MMDANQRPNPRYMRGAFTFELANHILELLMSGESLERIIYAKGDIEQHPDMPSRPIVYKWLAKGKRSTVDSGNVLDRYYRQFYEEYILAREFQAENIYEKIIEVENDVGNENLTPQQGNIILKSLRWRAGRMDSRFERSGKNNGPEKISYEVIVNRERITKNVTPLIEHDAEG